ncbi:fibronectin type III domain-containing protein, partial [Mesohalobacter salilacus]|uniref:fibronectin type III domain-containing protein n=1 Tax=Mesohalobacter salilacus TaxID=2491711 RepID=UPI000F93F70D
MKRIILLFGLLVTCWQINAQTYCTDGGPSSTFDTNVESVDLVGETTTIAYLGCQNAGLGVAGVEDLTGSQTADVVAGNSYTADVQFGTCGGNFASAGEAWIDFDRDGFFEPSESIGTVTGTAPFALQSLAVTVPNDAVNGSSRMRVMQWEGGALPLDPCGSFTWGSVTDFEIVISGGIDITCEQPFNVQLVEAFGSSADFTWDLAPNDQNGYIWEVFTAGADPDVDTPVSTGTVGSGVSTVNADGLSELTDYDFYVTTDCGATDGLSQRSNVVTFTTVFLCPAPSNVTVDGVVSDAFNINWNEIPNAANGYTWSVFNAGDDPTVDTPVFTGTEPFGTTSTTVTGLTSNITYDVYVSADCDTDGTSELSNVVTVTTPCTAVLAPITENFDGANWTSGTGFGNTGDAIDNCWQRTPDGSGFFWGTRTGTTGSTGTGPSAANSTPNYIYTEGSNGLSGDEAFLVSPLIDLSPLTDPALTFWYHMFGGDTGTISVDVDAGSGFDLDVFTISGQQQAAESDAFIEQIIDLSAYAGQTVTIRFRGLKGGGFASDMAIDDFKVDEAPTCLKTFNLALVEAFDVEAEVSWSLIGNATNGYIWEVYNAGDDPLTATPVATGTFAAGVTTGLLTGLTELTDYDLYIISDCGATDGLSDLAGPLSFSTIATCPSPTNIAVSNITENSADIAWDESFNASNGYNWELFLDGEDPATATPNQSGNVAFGTTTLSLTGLTDNVDYDFYITSDCDTDGLSLTEGPISFLTLPLPPANDNICDAIPLTVGVIPPGDTYTNLGATSETGEPEGACFNGGVNGSVWFTFVAPASGEVEVSTDIAGASLTDSEIAVYDAPTDCTDPTTMGAELGCGQDEGVVIGFNSIVNLTGLTGGTTYYVQVDQWGTTSPGDFGISVIDTNPPCPAPVNVVVSNTTNTTVDFSWDDVVEATAGYNWFVFNQGADTTTDTPVATGNVGVGVLNAAATGLTSNTTYDVYIQSDCGSAIGTSALSTPITFTTDCDAFTAPYTQDFETFTATTNLDIQDCFTEVSTGAFSWDVSNSDTPSFNTGPNQANSGTNFIFSEASSGLPGDFAEIETATVDISTLSAPVLRFYYHMFGGDMGTIHVDVNDGTGYDLDVFVLSGQQQANQDDPWVEQFVDLSAYAGATVTVKFRAERGAGFESDIAIDDVAFIESPPCLKPTNLALVDVFFDSAEVSWAGIGNAVNGYIWEVYNAGDDPATATPVSTGTFAAGTTQGIADGLTPETDYDLYLISDCGPDGVSDLTNPISFTTTVLCSLPSTFDVINLLPDSAELTWSSIPNAANGYNWAVFNAGDDPATATPVASGTAPSGDTSVVVTSLTDNTNYEAYITTDCGADGLSDQSMALAFTTPCNVFTAPIVEDFESTSWVSGTGFGNTGDAIDPCWDRDPDGSGYFWGTRSGETGSTGTGPSAANSGNNYVYTEGSNGNLDDEALFVSPLIDLSPLSAPALSFWYHMFGGDMGTLNVDVNAGSGYDLAVFSISGEQQTAGNDPWIEQFVDLSAYAGQTVQIRFRGVRGDGFASDTAIDDFQVDEAPSCLTPTGLTVTSIGITTADISWNVIGNASAGYNWLVFNQGDDPAIATPVTTGSVGTGVTTATINGLSAATNYDVYIQANCGATDGLSELSPEVTFETLCDIFVAPFFDDFEGFAPTTSLVEDECWNEVSTGGFTWNVTDNDTPSFNTGANQAFSGTNFVFSEASSGGLGDEALLLSPQIDLSTLTVPALSFYYHMFGGDMGTLHVDVDAGSGFDLDVFTLTGQQQVDQDDDWIQQFVDLSAYVGQTVTIRLRAERGDGFESDISIDDFRVDEAPTCFDPLNLEVLSVTDTTANLNWQAGSSETNFDVEVVTSGTAPTGTPTFEDVSVPFTATGLTSETTYDFYVRADCGPGDVSNWVGPTSFTTALTPVTVVVNDPAINNTYCYDNNEFKEWLFVSSDIANTPPTPVEVVFNGGTIEDGTGSTDRFRVFDGFDETAPVLYDSDVDGTDLAGVTLTASSGAAYMLLESDIFGSCQNGVDVEVPFDFDVFAGTMSTVAFSDNNFKYYPNPVSTTLTIDSANPIESVKVFNILGK